MALFLGDPWLMPLRLSFEKRFDGRITSKYIKQVPISCIHPSWKYYISGIRIRTDRPTEKVNGKTIGELESFLIGSNSELQIIQEATIYTQKEESIQNTMKSTQKSMEIYHVLLSHKVYHGKQCVSEMIWMMKKK